MGQLEERNKSLYETRLQEAKKKTADETRAYYLQCIHQLVNAKGQKRPSDRALESQDLGLRSHDVGLESQDLGLRSHDVGLESHGARLESRGAGQGSRGVRLEPGLGSRGAGPGSHGAGPGSHDTGLKSHDIQPGSRVPATKSTLQHASNWTMESRGTGPATKSCHATSKSDAKKRTVRSSSPKRDRPVSRVTSSLPDNEPGPARSAQKSLSKEVVSHRVVSAGKPRLVNTSKFVPKTKLILHTESKLVSPRGMYWAKEKDRLAGRIVDHQ